VVRTRSLLPRQVSGGGAGGVPGRGLGGLVVPALVVSSGGEGAGAIPAGPQQRASPVGDGGAIAVAGLGRRRRGGLGLRRC
jgi:hypothetical protein